QVGGEVGEGVGEFVDTAAFEGGVPDEDGAVGAEGFDQCLGEGAARVVGAVGEEFAVHDCAARVLDVARPLERHLLVRAGAGPDGDGEGDGLKVEVVQRPRQVGEDAGGVRVDPGPPGARRL